MFLVSFERNLMLDVLLEKLLLANIFQEIQKID